MQKIMFNDMEYSIEKDENNIFNYAEISERVTDYFNDYDYIFGDMSYNKIRLKGFYESNNKKHNNINDIKGIDNYIKNYCAVGCKWFLLKKCNKC